jgi:hypothetical protein
VTEITGVSLLSFLISSTASICRTSSAGIGVGAIHYKPVLDD